MTSTEERSLEVLDEDECRRLLPTAVIGRLAFTEGALPAIQPVSFGVVGDQIVIPTRVGSKVAVASRGAIVAFEVDAVDATARTGWNVTVVGPSRVATDAAEVARLEALGLAPWAPAPIRCFVLVGMRIIRGRRIRAAGPASARPGAAERGPVVAL